MDLSFTRQNVRISEPVFDDTAEHPVECEILLPDYCPDIARILKTESGAQIDSKSIEGEKMTVDGSFYVKIIYIPENSSNVRCFTNQTPFTHSFILKQAEEGPTYEEVKPKVQFSNCRPIGPRRVHVRASVAVSAKVWKVAEESFITDCENDGVELLKKPVKACSLVGEGEKQFKVDEEFEIGYGKPPAASIIKTDAVVRVQDCKIISNKIIAKAEVVLKTLYSCEDDNGGLETMENSVPLSQVIDIDGIDENCVCDVHFTPGEIQAETAANGDAENRIVAYEFTVTAEARAYREQEFFVVGDAFSTTNEMNLQKKQVNFENIAGIAKYSEMLKFSLDALNAEVSKISDCKANPVTSNVAFSGSTMTVEGSMEISIIGADMQGSPISVDKSMPFSIKEEIQNASGQLRCDPEIQVVSVDCSVAGPDRIDLRVECSLNAAVFGVTSESIIEDMQIDDTKEKEHGKMKTLTLYFADQGESVWDIAKRYNTSVNAIMNENKLENDKLETRSILLIPKTRTKASLTSTPKSKE